MVIPETEFTLKDGRRALIRCPREEDIPGTLEYLFRTAGETEFLLRYPEECDKYTPEGEKAFFERVNRADNEAMLMCIVDGKVAGNCQITWSKALKTRHRASIGIAILREYWGLGIGTRLIRELIRIAEQTEHLVQIELDFIEGPTSSLLFPVPHPL